ncbi:MAG: hypothetical protein U0Q10_09395 [Dermatophilaceae bacterium]
MSKRGHGSNRRTPNRSATRGRPPVRTHTAMRPEDQELIQGIRTAMRAEPLALADLMSSVLDALDPNSVTPGLVDKPTLTQLVESFIDVPLAETTAALMVIATLTSDELLAARIRREIDGRRHPMPLGVSGLDDLRIVSAWAMAIPGDVGDDLILGLSAPGVPDSSLLVYIDHRFGTLVKDAFLIDESVPQVVANLSEIALRDGHRANFVEVSLADARAQVEPAIAAYGNIDHGMPPGDTWPGLRPLLSHLVRLLPEGGTPLPPRDPADFDELEELEEDASDLAHDFLSGPFGAPVLGDDPADHDLAHVLAMFALDMLGDELLWTPEIIETLMTSALPTILARELYERAPAVLRAFVSYCHDVDGCDQSDTAAALVAVDRWEPRYHELRDDPEIVRARIEALTQEWRQLHREALLTRLSPDLVAGLNADPLPDEPLDLSGVASDIATRVQGIASLADVAAMDLYDVEMRTACRRLIAQVALADPAIFRRQSRDAMTAAAFLWIVAKANDALTDDGNPTVAELMAAFELTGSPSQRAMVLLKAIGQEQPAAYGLRLNDPALLTARLRSSWLDILNP